jgi:periplasmic protein TonB
MKRYSKRNRRVPDHDAFLKQGIRIDRPPVSRPARREAIYACLWVIGIAAFISGVAWMPGHVVWQERMEIIVEEPPKQDPPPEPPPPPPRPEPEPVIVPSPEPQTPPVFGLDEKDASESGDMEAPIGNTLMVSQDSIVQPKSEPPPPVQDTVDYETPYLESLRKEIGSHYPSRAKKFRIEGSLKLYLLLEKTGRIAKAAIISGSGHDVLDNGVLNWLEQIRFFNPFPAGLKKDSWELEIPVSFRLH